MRRLIGKRVLVGVTGSIAAYKAAEIVRCLTKGGAEVRVAMTPSACEFITPLTLQALSKNPVHTLLLDPDAESSMGHIELARWADVVLIAPASADFMAQLVAGRGDNLLSAICLATHTPVFIAPAMNQAMWQDAATRHNCKMLKERGIIFLGPDSGIQACGEKGLGRMLEVEDVITLLSNAFRSEKLSGLRVLITAGPTQEAIDPVRYISNHSSGKMGFSLAAAAAEYGAAVTLIAGPVHLETPERVRRVDVISANEMYRCVQQEVGACDIFIGAAAVADYRPSTASEEKIKKQYSEQGDGVLKLNLELTATQDIVAYVASLKENRPFVVGFAAETRNVPENAMAKLRRKKMDIVMANDVSDPTIGFNSNDNQVTVIGHDFEDVLPKMSKKQTARFLMDIIASNVNVKHEPVKEQNREKADTVAEVLTD